MIKYILFNKSGSVEKEISANYKKPGKDELLFIYLSQPTKEEIEKVSSDFKFDKTPLSNFGREVHSRRYITLPFQFLMKSVYLENKKIEFKNLLFILMSNCIIAASSKESNYYSELVEHVYEEFKKTKVRGILHIFCNFLQEDVDENYEVLGDVEGKIKDIEFKAASFEKEIKVNVDDIIFLKSQLFRLSRQFWAVARVISLIRMGVARVPTDQESVHVLIDVHETFLHQIDVAAAQKEMLSDALNVYATGITTRLAKTSNELNIIVKKLTAYSVILIAPTVVTGLYGMNFEFIPLSHLKFGFLLLTGMVLLIMGSIFTYFKKNDWL